MTIWKTIDSCPKNTPVLLNSYDWEHADVGIHYDDGAFCDCIEGGDFSPDPTHWTEIPKLETRRRYRMTTQKTAPNEDVPMKTEGKISITKEGQDKLCMHILLDNIYCAVDDGYDFDPEDMAVIDEIAADYQYRRLPNTLPIPCKDVEP